MEVGFQQVRLRVWMDSKKLEGQLLYGCLQERAVFMMQPLYGSSCTRFPRRYTPTVDSLLGDGGATQRLLYASAKITPSQCRRVQCECVDPSDCCHHTPYHTPYHQPVNFRRTTQRLFNTTRDSTYDSTHDSTHDRTHNRQVHRRL